MTANRRCGMWPSSAVIHGLRAQEAKALIQVHFHLWHAAVAGHDHCSVETA